MGVSIDDRRSFTVKCDECVMFNHVVFDKTQALNVALLHQELHEAWAVAGPLLVGQIYDHKAHDRGRMALSQVVRQAVEGGWRFVCWNDWVYMIEDGDIDMGEGVCWAQHVPGLVEARLR